MVSNEFGSLCKVFVAKMAKLLLNDPESLICAYLSDKKS